MYCRKCGKKIPNRNTKFCDNCGADVIFVKAKTDAELYEERRKNGEFDKKPKTKVENKYADLKNPYVNPGFALCVIALGLGLFPYQKEWGIGTSLWMQFLIFGLAIVGMYLLTQARKVNRAFKRKYNYEVNPNRVSSGYLIGAITMVVAGLAIMFSL